jgi:hypothetical protein
MPVWRGGKFRLVVCVVAAGIAGAAPARADPINVHVDQARVVNMPERVATIVIGNPLIADATLQGGGILVVTGKGYGATNLLALDRNGRVLLDKTVEVSGPGSKDLVVVYKGVDRESYSCTPVCAPRITLGDSEKFFASTLGATGTRNGLAGAGGAK